MTTIIYQFTEKNILIKSIGAHQYTFSFNGTEDEFVTALLEVMDKYDYTKQDEEWFPGDPCNEGNKIYYIQKVDSEDLYIGFNWGTKEVFIT